MLTIPFGLPRPYNIILVLFVVWKWQVIFVFKCLHVWLKYDSRAASSSGILCYYSGQKNVDKLQICTREGFKKSDF